MAFGMCFMRFMLMAEATYSALSKQLRSHWRTVSFVRLTTGAWRCISLRGAVNGVPLGSGEPGDFYAEGSGELPHGRGQLPNQVLQPSDRCHFKEVRARPELQH